MPTGLPHRTEVMWLVLRAMRDLDRQATAREICERVVVVGGLSSQQQSIPGPKSKPRTSRIEDEVAWSLFALRKGAHAVDRTKTRPARWFLTQKADALTADAMRAVLRESLKP